MQAGGQVWPLAVLRHWVTTPSVTAPGVDEHGFAEVLAIGGGVSLHELI